jgi:hypothetical protein
MNGELPDTSSPSIEQQVLVSQALLEEMQRQLQELQAAAALHAAPSSSPPVTPPAPEHTPLTNGQHLKPNRPTRYSGVKDHTTIENWTTSVNSYFVIIFKI